MKRRKLALLLVPLVLVGAAIVFALRPKLLPGTCLSGVWEQPGATETITFFPAGALRIDNPPGHYAYIGRYRFAGERQIDIEITNANLRISGYYVSDSKDVFLTNSQSSVLRYTFRLGQSLVFKVKEISGADSTGSASRR